MAKVLLDTCSKVVGVTFKNDNGEDIQDILSELEFKYKTPLTFIREPNNPYDNNAIKIFANNKHIGYMKKELSTQVAPMIDDGHIIKGYIDDITGIEIGQIHGCNYKITILENEVVLPKQTVSVINSEFEQIKINKKTFSRKSITIYRNLFYILGILTFILVIYLLILKEISSAIPIFVIVILLIAMANAYNTALKTGKYPVSKHNSNNSSFFERNVYISKNGKKYHYNKNCINGKVYNTMTENQAKISGLTKCDKCCK